MEHFQTDGDLTKLFEYLCENKWYYEAGLLIDYPSVEISAEALDKFTPEIKKNYIGRRPDPAIVAMLRMEDRDESVATFIKDMLVSGVYSIESIYRSTSEPVHHCQVLDNLSGMLSDEQFWLIDLCVIRHTFDRLDEELWKICQPNWSSTTSYIKQRPDVVCQVLMEIISGYGI